MNLTLHVIRKDARALRLAWALWMSLAAAEVILVVLAFHTVFSGAEAYNHAVVVINGVAILWAIGGYLLVAAVILQDPPVGTKAFWLTRPITGIGLLRSKMLWVFAFLVLAPSLLWVPWGAYCHYDAAGIFWELFRDCRMTLLIIFPAIVIATLSGDGPRFMLYNVLLAASVAASGTILAAAGKGFIKLDVPLLLLAVFGTAAVLVQFFSRRRWIAVGLAATGLALVLLSAALWPNAALSRSRPRVEGSSVAALVSAKIGPHPRLIKLKDGSAYALKFFIDLSGLPADAALDSGYADVSLSWPDGSHLRFDDVRLSTRDVPSETYSGKPNAVAAVLKLPSQPGNLLDPESLAKFREQWREGQDRMLRRYPTWKVRPVPDYNIAHEPAFVFGAWIEITPDIARRIEASPPRCEVSMDAFLVRPVIIATVPLGRANQESENGARIDVQSSEMSYAPEIKNSFLDASIVFDSEPDCPLQGFVYDSRGGTPTDIWAGGLISGASTKSAPRQNLGFISVHLPADRLWRTGHWVEDPAWRASARLAAVTLKSAGSFNMVVRTDRLDTNWGEDP